VGGWRSLSRGTLIDQPAPFTVDVTPEGDSLVASLRGELDMAGAPILRDALGAAVEKDPDSLVIDLSDLTFLDSCGLAELVKTRKLLQASKQMVVHRARPNVRQVFTITGLDEVFTFED
jgi:anti-sigma B factor antagonist